MSLKSWGLLYIGASALLIGGCSQSGDEATAAGAAAQTAVITIPDSALYSAETRAIKPKFTLPALVEAEQNAKIRPQIQAPIKAIHFRAGDQVKKDDLLVELDPAKFEAQLDAAAAQLQSAEASAAQAKTTWDRAQKLIGKGHISGMDYDRAKAGMGTAKASVAQAEAGYQRAKLDLEHTKIYAPFDGKISKPRRSLGDLVGPLAVTPLFELVQLDPIYVTTEVAISTYNDFVALRMKAEAEHVEVPELVVYLELAGGAEYPETGNFEAWSHASSSGSGVIAGRVVFPNPRGLLLPGQNVTLRGEAAQKVDRVMVPQKAVMQDQQGHYIKVLDDNNTVQRRNIEVGLRQGADWAVPLGLEEGEKVIVSGAQGLKPGTQVSISD